MTVGVDGKASGRVDEVFAQAVALFHQGVEILTRRVHGNPARVVAGVRAVDGSDEVDLGRVWALLAMNPELVGPQVGRVEVRLCRVEDHAVDARVGLVLVVLHIVGELSVVVNGEDAAVAGVVVKGIRVDTVGGLFGSEEEYGAGVGVCRRCLGCMVVRRVLASPSEVVTRGRLTVVKHGVGCLVDDFGRRLDGEAGPLLHGGAVNVFLCMLLKIINQLAALC